MAMHAIVVVRDEADVVGEMLTHTLEWADEITVFDSGSVDTTWDIVQEMASRERGIHALESRPVYFSSAVRGYVFEADFEVMTRCEWLVLSEADEFYATVLTEFVREFTKPSDGQVFKHAFNSVFTHSLASAWESDRAGCGLSAGSVRERGMPFVENTFEEPRMYRYRRGMCWPAGLNSPLRGGLPCSRRIVIEHYPVRDPVQASKRFVLRNEMRRRKLEKGLTGGGHWAQDDWRDSVRPDDDPEVWSRDRVAALARDASASRSLRAAKVRSKIIVPGVYQVFAGLADAVKPCPGVGFDLEPIPDDVQSRVASGYAEAAEPPRFGA